jgi:plastocyanin
VKLSGLRFAPQSLTVHAGDRIQWLNDDLVPHTATAKDKAFDSGDIAAGQSWTFVAREAGTFDYACRYHPMMTGRLVVQ